MKASNPIWKEKLEDQIPKDLARQIDIFETEIALRQQGKIEERLFGETRLRKGVYGQRYDNGKRHDGVTTRALNYEAKITKGVSTVWDAPGMQRIKIPYGGLNARQLEVLAELTEEYADGIAHVTTRQDFQLHFIHIEDTPAIMRRLASAGITTHEACGNVVRNITACPYAGVCRDEAFDVTPYAKALAYFLMGHPDTQDFGRKFKPAFSGCKQHACGLVHMHDLGAIGVTQQMGGKTVQGFEIYVGGGLGAVPHQAKLLDPFLPTEELLPVAQSIARVFARLGEKQNRSRARLKFLVKDLGIEKFKGLVLEERKHLPFDPRWQNDIKDLKETETPLKGPGTLHSKGPKAFQEWLQTNLRPQRQEGYAVVTVTLPLGDITANQLRALADISRKYTHESVRTTVEQNMVLRWVSLDDIPALYKELEAIGLGASGAGHVIDMVACPGTDTCKLGIASSRGLASELRRRLAEQVSQLDPAIHNLHIKMSGCFNSCGHHNIADMGFYGVSRKVAGYAVPHFQVVLGGQWENNAGSYGLPIIAIPSKNIPQVFDRLTRDYLTRRKGEEKFKDYVDRIGKAALRTLVEDLSRVPSYEEDPSYYSDWGDPREFSLGDIGAGECAGEVVLLIEVELASAEREAFEAQVALEKNATKEASNLALAAMMRAAKALIKTEFLDVPEDYDVIIREFQTRFFDTQKIFDPFAGPKFAQYFFRAYKNFTSGHKYTPETTHHLIEEALLFIETVHSCYNRMGNKN